MMLLALEASAKAASCAVVAESGVVASAFQATGLTHSRTLLPMVEAMLRNSELSLEQMDAVAVSVGPGSFTGLRIGLATAKGLAWGTEKPCVPVSTLEAMAWPLRHLPGTIVCAMDARRSQIYNAAFSWAGGALHRLRPDRAIALEEAAEDLKDLPGPLTIVGDGATLCRDYFVSHGIACQLAPSHLVLQSAVGVGLAACERFPEGAVSAQDLAPTYLRLSQAERERLARENA
jgi:tRNA threonylcarbamoyladenosine biosynthesis protein TsaB